MTQLIVREDRELRRIENAIATIESARACSGLRNDCLLAALKAERDELLRIAGRGGRLSRIARGQARPPARLTA